MKKTKLIATIMTICLAISTLAYGVYAATNLSFTIGANIAFEVDNLFVDVDAFVYNAYNQAGDTRLGTTQTLSDASSVTALSQAVMDNSDGLSVIDDTDLEWDLTGQNLYFNSSDITEKMTFRIEVKNYSPSSQIKVTIAPTVATATALTNAGITGGSANASGNAVAYNGTTAETAVAEYTLALTDLATPINQTTIEFTVNINEYSPYNVTSTAPASGLLPWDTDDIASTTHDNHLVTWYNENDEMLEYDELSLASPKIGSGDTIYGIKGPELLTATINTDSISISGNTCSLYRKDGMSMGDPYLYDGINITQTNFALPPYVMVDGVNYKLTSVKGSIYSDKLFESSNEYEITLPNTVTNMDGCVNGDTMVKSLDASLCHNMESITLYKMICSATEIFLPDPTNWSYSNDFSEPRTWTPLEASILEDPVTAATYIKSCSHLYFQKTN